MPVHIWNMSNLLSKTKNGRHCRDTVSLCMYVRVCSSYLIDQKPTFMGYMYSYSMYSLTPSSSGDRSQLSPLGGGPWFSPKYHAQSEIELPRIHAHSLHLYHQTYCSLYSCVLASNSRIHPAYCALCC